MNARSVLAGFLRFGPNEGQIAAELLDSEQPIRLPPALTVEELPPEFEDVLEVQVLGYRERLTLLYGHGCAYSIQSGRLFPRTGDTGALSLRVAARAETVAPRAA